MLDSNKGFFVKFTDKVEYRQQFIAGKLFMSRLRCFQEADETKLDGGRPDGLEGVTITFQRGSIINLTGNGLPDGYRFELAEGESASIYCDWHLDLHIFCMTAINIPERSTFCGNDQEFDDLIASLTSLNISDDDFGPYAAIIRQDVFIAHLKARMADLPVYHDFRLVEYYDDKASLGSILPSVVPFRKQRKFQHQKEARFCLHSAASVPLRFSFEIGSMSSEAICVPTSEVNTYIRKLIAQEI